MKLKNYTSEVPAWKSVGQVEKDLVAIGATNINKEYKDGKLVGIKFIILINGNSTAFSIPAKVDRIFDVLMAQVKRPIKGTKEKNEKQAERTAWKTISEWVKIQCDMILLEQAEPLQLFLPYFYDPKSNTTLYDRVQSGSIKLLE